MELRKHMPSHNGQGWKPVWSNRFDISCVVTTLHWFNQCSRHHCWTIILLIKCQFLTIPPGIDQLRVEACSKRQINKHYIISICGTSTEFGAWHVSGRHGSAIQSAEHPRSMLENRTNIFLFSKGFWNQILPAATFSWHVCRQSHFQQKQVPYPQATSISNLHLAHLVHIATKHLV